MVRIRARGPSRWGEWCLGARVRSGSRVRSIAVGKETDGCCQSIAPERSFEVLEGGEGEARAGFLDPAARWYLGSHVGVSPERCAAKAASAFPEQKPNPGRRNFAKIASRAPRFDLLVLVASWAQQMWGCAVSRSGSWDGPRAHFPFPPQQQDGFSLSALRRTGGPAAAVQNPRYAASIFFKICPPLPCIVRGARRSVAARMSLRLVDSKFGCIVRPKGTLSQPRQAPSLIRWPLKTRAVSAMRALLVPGNRKIRKSDPRPTELHRAEAAARSEMHRVEPRFCRGRVGMAGSLEEGGCSAFVSPDFGAQFSVTDHWPLMSWCQLPVRRGGNVDTLTKQFLKNVTRDALSAMAVLEARSFVALRVIHVSTIMFMAFCNGTRGFRPFTWVVRC